MITATLLSLAASLTVSSSATVPVSGTEVEAARPSRRTADQELLSRPIRDLDGRVIGDEGDVEEAFGGGFANPFGPQARVSPFLYGTWQVTLTDTGTAWEEPFLIGVPRNPQWPVPMLVAFHGWGNTQQDIVVNTKYFQKAMQRGWIVVAPLGAHKFNQCIDYSQQNTEAALDWVISNFAIDPTRVYGVGFSMGGGNASTYAARHLDPTGVRFAALIDHTGSTSIEDVWTHAADKSMLEHALMFGGSPAQFPFRYQTASSIDLDAGGNIDPSADFARNLVRTPLKVFAVSGDPQQHLVEQSTLFHGHLTNLGGSPVLQIVPGTNHKWHNLNEVEALDWLQQHTWVEPDFNTPVKVLADRNARWWHFTIQQKTAGQFSPFRWTVDDANDRVVLDQMSNVASVRFNPVEAGLPATPVEVMINLTAAGSIEIVLDGFELPPASVTRTGGGGASWTHDPIAKTLTLHETVGTGYPRWTVTK